MDVEDGTPRISRSRRIRLLPIQLVYFLSLEVYIVEFQGGRYRTTCSSRSRFVLISALCSSECILEEGRSPGVEVLVFSLILRIREISTSSSPAVEPGGKR